VIKGLRTCIYCVPNIEEGKAWYSKAFEKEPYFDEPYYVGFNVEGYELGLLPAQEGESPGAGGSTAYWSAPELESEIERLCALGASVKTPIQDVGEGIRVATLTDPFGNVFGLIDNPQFKIT